MLFSPNTKLFIIYMFEGWNVSSLEELLCGFLCSTPHHQTMCLKNGMVFVLEDSPQYMLPALVPCHDHTGEYPFALKEEDAMHWHVD